MDERFRLFPQQASTVAPEVDALYFYLCAITAFFTLLIFALICYFGLKYRRRGDQFPNPPKIHTNFALELAWTVIPFALCVTMFVWSTGLFVKLSRPPADSMNIFVVGKQWMWKVQHPTGQREINTLHAPLGRPVKLIMSSEDVIHSFFIPAFRIKQDVVPGRNAVQWFQASRVGEYHLFCAEYCGAEHSRMIGKVVVTDEAGYQAWLAGAVRDEPMPQAGERLFIQLGCNTCHGQRGPTMAGLYGRHVQVTEDGVLKTVVADDAYLREAILNAPQKLTVGFPAIMPSYRGQVTEEQLFQLIEYIKSLKTPQRDW
ncbi:MAG: cytochrome c oxidase subunit II [Tepidisphaeraceae bacterium]